jgi:predicted membrane-bound spermidine synthase
MPPTTNATSTRTPFGLLLGAVASAGAASLVYEVVWIRELGMSLGSTAIASSVMLSSFLAGLALGSWISGKRVDASPSPLRTLVRIELLAAAIGALSVPVLGAAGRAYVYLAATTAAGPGVSLALRAAFSIVVVLVPATLFGMTFPVATSAAARLVDVSKAGGWVSAASSFGSAVGALLAGLALEPLLGLTGSALAGATINVLAAGIAWLARREVAKLAD